MSKNERTPSKSSAPSFSFVTPPPSNRNLYGQSESSQGTEVLSQATEALSQATEELSTPPLSPVASPRNGAASSAFTPRLKRTEEAGYRGAPVFIREGRYWTRVFQKDGTYTNLPSDATGDTTVPVNDPSRIARTPMAHVRSNLSNLSLATPISQRNVVARAAASNAPVLSLTPAKRKQEARNQNSNSNSNQNKASGGSRKRTHSRRTHHKRTHSRRTHHTPRKGKKTHRTQRKRSS